MWVKNSPPPTVLLFGFSKRWQVCIIRADRSTGQKRVYLKNGQDHRWKDRQMNGSETIWQIVNCRRSIYASAVIYSWSDRTSTNCYEPSYWDRAQGSKLTVANLPPENPICHLLKTWVAKKLLPGNSVMKVLSWKNKPIFTKIILLYCKTKHNSIWSKALSMPLTMWNFVWS